MPSLKRVKREGLASGAGLIRYFDVDEGGLKLDPKMILGLVSAVIIVELMAKLFLT